MSLFPPDDPKALSIQGLVESVVYRSHDGLFAVIRLQHDTTAEEVTAIGDLGRVNPGETLRLRGRFSQHPVHGRRFQVASFTPVSPSSKHGIARYLGSGLVPGIGKALAERLVDSFGDQTLDVITQQSGRLTEIPGIGKQRAHAIAQAVRERRDETDLMAYLHGLGLGPALARRIRKRYGERAVHVIREDPYLVAEQVPGVGFKTADAIGRASGLSLDDPRRAAGAVLHLLGELADAGHVYATREQLASAAETLEVPRARMDEAIAALTQRDLVVVERSAVYAAPLYHAEVDLASQLSRRCKDALVPAPDACELRELNLSEAQTEAVRATFGSPLLVITGGPGTGKTTTVRGIVQAQRAAGRNVVLCAPTGRAAKRLSESAGIEARTIHRLLEWNPATAQFQRDAENPIEADLLLIDEASMLNLQLAQRLVSAVPPQAPIVFVGDVDQLPPVGPGQVLRALIESGVAPVVRLSTIFRQAQESDIVKGAHAILEGTIPELSEAGARGKGELFFVKTRDADAALARLSEMLKRLPTAYGLDPKREVMVLAPMRRGPLGTERLNTFLQAELNPADRPTAGPRPGDRVMQLVNDYEKETFNGDLGEVRTVAGGVFFVTMDGREVRYKHEDQDQITLAYASTIHKVQGSEFPAVFVVLHRSHHLLLSRALLYTAITRAKQLVVLLGEERALARAIRNAHSYACQSRLSERISALGSRTKGEPQRRETPA